MAEYLEKWKTAKLTFERSTKVKKPSPTVAKIRVGTGLEKALKAVETAQATFENSKDKNDKLAQAVVAAAKTYTTTKENYLKTLQAAAQKEAVGTDKETYLKGIKVLSTELKAIDAEIKVRLGYNASAVAKSSVTEGLAKNLMASTDASSRRATAFIAKLKAEPSADYFNANILKVARDINQSIGNIDKLTAKGYKFDRQEPKYLFEALRPWADGSRKLKTTATPKEVLAEVGELETAVKEVRRWLKG